MKLSEVIEIYMYVYIYMCVCVYIYIYKKEWQKLNQKVLTKILVWEFSVLIFCLFYNFSSFDRLQTGEILILIWIKALYENDF